MTPDPYRATATSPSDPKNPTSWNRYAYVGGDPINATDPRGLLWCIDCPNAGGDPGEPPCVVFDFEGGVACDPGPIGPPPPPPPQRVFPQCSIELWERPTPSGGPAKGWGRHTYIFITDSDYPGLPGIMAGFMIEAGPVKGLLTGMINPPGQGLAAGKWNASDPNNPSNTEVGTDYKGPDACDDVIGLLNAVNAYNSGPKDHYAFLGTTNSNAFTYTLLSDIGLASNGTSIFGNPSGFTPGWGQTINGLVVP